MSVQSIFRLKVQYKKANEETGEVEKAKMEILAQCEDYTDAEAVLYKIIDQYQFDKFEPCTYDIVRAKMLPGNIYGRSPLVADDGGKLTCGLLQHFFENEHHGLYEVNAVVTIDNDLKKVCQKRTIYVPANNVADATSAATEVLKYDNDTSYDFHMPSVKLDNAALIYLLPETSESIYKFGNTIFS